MIDKIFCEITAEKEVELSGETYNTFSAKKVNKADTFYIVKSGNTYSHGKELKQAFEDLKFKLISEKLKNAPIEKDTLLTVQYYRLLTGACDFGCRSWLEANKIPYDIIDDKTVEKEPMKAVDLLPILKKSNAYGFEKFSKLLTF